MRTLPRSFISNLQHHVGHEVKIRGWIFRIRELAKTTFILVKDCTGIVQCVGSTDILHASRLREEDAIEIRGSIREETRAHGGFELDILAVVVLNPAKEKLPFHSASDLSSVRPEILLDYRPLALRNERIGDIFRVQGAILRYFREFLIAHQFTEIISSKIVAGGTEGGTNLFAIRYFERVAYLAQSPQFYKEHGIAGFERVFETGHVYRAEPHATSRHLTEYYSLDLEIGFIDGPEDVIQLERELLSFIFAKLNDEHAPLLSRFRSNPLPPMLQVPIWDFDDCIRRLRAQFGRTELTDDLDPAAERQLCSLAEQEFGVPADESQIDPDIRSQDRTGHLRREQTGKSASSLSDGNRLRLQHYLVRKRLTYVHRPKYGRERIL